MSDRSHKLVIPFQMSKRNQEISGSLLLADMERVVELVEECSGEVGYELTFAFGESRLPTAKGRFWFDVGMVCQRCLEPVQVSIEGEIGLIFVSSEKMLESIETELDPYVIDKDEFDETALDEMAISLSELIEDEIILALPISPKHMEDSECNAVQLPENSGENEEETPGEDRIFPFAGLGEMLKNQKH